MMSDAPTFDAFFDEVYPRAWNLARRILGDPALAEDVAAESLARAYARWSRVRALPWRSGWVMKTAARLAIATNPQHSPFADAAASLHEEDAIVTRLALVTALRALPRRQREAITLHFLSDLTEGDVAKVLGISTGAVKTHIHRGMTALRHRLGEEEEAGLVVS
jgi:RNA polymerase sigma-70 factor (ECF subfamily)